MPGLFLQKERLAEGLMTAYTSAQFGLHHVFDRRPMEQSHDRDDKTSHRRSFLKCAAGVAAVAAAGLASRAVAEDAALDALIGDTQRGGFGQGFDEASRTIHMPKPSEPTVSAATAQTTEQAIDRYAAIVGRGGWPHVRSEGACGWATVIRACRRCAPGSSPRATSTRMRSATTSTIPTSRPRCGAFRPATA